MFANPEVAFGGTRQLLSLIDLIYSAVQTPSIWSTVMEQIAEAVDGESTTMFARFPDQQLFSMARTDPAAWNSYAGYYASINSVMNRCDEVFADGEVRYADRVMPDAELEKTEFYNDFFKPQSMHYSLGIKIPMGALPAAYISCQRPKSKGPFGEHQGLVYEVLMPHLQRALGLSFQFARTRSHALGLETALDAFQHAVFGLNRTGVVVVSNRHAEKIAQAAASIRLVNGRLTAVLPNQNKRLSELIAEALRPGGQDVVGTAGSMLLPGRSGSTLRLTMTPFSSGLHCGSVQISALVFVSDPAQIPLSRRVVLRNLYSLTPTETRIAELLSQGFEVREIANSVGTTVETTRFHVKRLLAKTGAKKQSELMRLMLSLPAV